MIIRGSKFEAKSISFERGRYNAGRASKKKVSKLVSCYVLINFFLSSCLLFYQNKWPTWTRLDWWEIKPYGCLNYTLIIHWLYTRVQKTKNAYVNGVDQLRVGSLKTRSLPLLEHSKRFLEITIGRGESSYSEHFHHFEDWLHYRKCLPWKTSFHLLICGSLIATSRRGWWRWNRLFVADEARKKRNHTQCLSMFIRR